MFHRHRQVTPGSPISAPRAGAVRVLQSEAELQAAVERAREFERRGVDAGQRRVGSYDRVLGTQTDGLATVLPIAPEVQEAGG
jgi:hypothetical protein